MILEWGSIIDTGVKAITPKIIDAVVKSSPDAVRDLIGTISGIDFEPYFHNCFDRCMRMKTLFSGNQSVPFLQNYVAPSFTYGNRIFDEYEIIDEIWDAKKISVLGSAGSGKSMFLRYFWISCFVQQRGKIPILIELRDFNDEGGNDFENFLFNKVIGGEDSASRKRFFNLIELGSFVFILDAFDEIKRDRRKYAEDFIARASLHNNMLVLSSRPSEGLRGLRDINFIDLSPLSLDKANAIINTIDFDERVKSKFLDELNKSAFEEHKSFASRPLLLMLMLMSYDQYANIPNKMHIFYDQAFDVLYLKHDASKETFTRNKYTNLAIDVFKYVFSCFCLITYNDSKTEFTDSQMMEYIKKASKFTSEKFDAYDFLQDMFETVNLIHKDGLKYVFSHRSFQEYFVAYCIMRLSEAKATQVMEKFLTREADDIFIMLYDMNKDFVCRLLFLPALDQYDAVTKHRGKFKLTKYIFSLNINLVATYSPTRTEESVSRDKNDPMMFTAFEADYLPSVRSVVSSIFREEMSFGEHGSMYHDFCFKACDRKQFKDMLLSINIDIEDCNFVTVFLSHNEIRVLYRDSLNNISQLLLNSQESANVHRSICKHFDDFKFSDFIRQKHSKIISIRNQMRKETRIQSLSIDSLL